MALASLLVSRLSALPASIHRAATHNDDAASIMSDDATHSLATSSLSSSFDTRSCHSEPSPDAPSISTPRPNEHLAVFLPKSLWKPDSQAAHCDTFMCRKPFSIWERRHHCRKCGGVFCGDCSSRSTTLLDASKLSFFHPPHNVPIILYDSPQSPVTLSRVCDECWDQVHGCKTPRSPVIAKSSPIALARTSESPTHSGASSISSSVSTPPDGSPLYSLAPRPVPRRTHTSPRIPASPLRTNAPFSPISSVGDQEPSLGELDSYPLRHASNICKATGGGRWQPKPVTEYVAKRIPGCKAPYELELEREEEELRIRRANPIIKNGDFQLRAPREFEPRSPGGPFVFSTF